MKEVRQLHPALRTPRHSIRQLGSVGAHLVSQLQLVLSAATRATSESCCPQLWIDEGALFVSDSIQVAAQTGGGAQMGATQVLLAVHTGG